MTIYDERDEPISVIHKIAEIKIMRKINHHYQNIYRRKLLEKIESLNTQVFSRDDLTLNHTNQEQLRLNRALKTFIEQGHIIKISHGLYTKATTINFPNGKRKIILRDSFESIAVLALNKLGLQWEYGSAIQAYNRGETTQIPVVFSVKLHSRFRGTISAEGRSVVFEGDINAR